jgi:hypothetical protein
METRTMNKPKMFWRKLFFDTPKREALFRIQSRIAAIMGSKIPLVICAN